MILSRFAVIAKGLAVAAALVAGVSAAPAGAAKAAPAGAIRTPAGLPAHRSTARAGTAAASAGALLINGDRIAISGAGGRTAVVITPSAHGFAGSMLALRLGAASYEIPADALPYLGRGLDPSLFDVGDLTAKADNSRLLVRIAYAGGMPSLPGVTITGTAHGVAAGYLTASSAKTFGAALLRQFEADHVRGSYGSDGMFADGVSISLAGAPAAPARTSAAGAARPGYVMRTLTVRGTNLAGKPDTGDTVMVVNADDATRFGDPDFIESLNFFYDGTAKYSVPTGHYWALAAFVDMDKAGNPVATRLSVLPQFSVSGGTSVSISERAASSKIVMRTPRPSTPQEYTFDLVRSGAAGPPVSLVSSSVFGFPLWVSPTSQRPTVGGLETFTSAQLASPASAAAAPYQYNLAFQDLSGEVHKQQFTVSPSSLATVNARYYADAASYGATLPLGLYPDPLSNPGQAFAFNFPVPVRRTEYMTAGDPPVVWFDEFFQDGGSLSGGQNDAGRVFRPGQVAADDWNAYPLHTALNENSVGARSQQPVLVSASRSGNTLTLDMSPFGDSTPGHTGSGFAGAVFGSTGSISGSYEVDRDGTKIAAGNALASPGATGGDFYKQVPLAPGAATVRVVLNASRTGTLYTLSTQTQTVWTWRSAAAASGIVPSGWACRWSLATGPSGRDCTPQPLLTLNYAVRGLSLSGHASPGRQTLAIQAGHMALAATPKVTRAAVAVSFDDGETWRPAAVTRSGTGSYLATFTAPANRYVTLRVTAADAVGGQITETITRAYASGSAPSDPPGPAGNGTAFRAACPTAPAGHVRCFAIYAPQTTVNRAIAAGKKGSVAVPGGWGAKDIESAYQLPVSRNPHQTVAIVDAYSTPNLESYLNTYRKQYGLPQCTAASGCLRIVNQSGKPGPLPPSGVPVGWAMETTLDADMVSAACPQCHIIVVEANTAGDGDMAVAEDTAARLGATVISNSYGGRETGYGLTFAKAYDHPGHAIVVAAGDYGFTAANFPADLATVTAVGGTQLAKARNGRGWLEQVWNNKYGAGGSGCSAYAPKPSWQHDPDCPGRTVADVAAVAWNVAVYNKDYGGWQTEGGTSAAAPLIAGIYALAGNAARIKPGYEYAHVRSLYPVTAGNNDWWAGTGGAACGYDYLCVAKAGYNGPGGLGTPHGTGAF